MWALVREVLLPGIRPLANVCATAGPTTGSKVNLHGPLLLPDPAPNVKLFLRRSIPSIPFFPLRMPLVAVLAPYAVGIGPVVATLTVGAFVNGDILPRYTTN